MENTEPAASRGDAWASVALGFKVTFFLHALYVPAVLFTESSTVAGWLFWLLAVTPVLVLWLFPPRRNRPGRYLGFLVSLPIEFFTLLPLALTFSPGDCIGC